MAKPSRSNREADRKARLEELQRSERAAERRRILVVAGIVGLVVVVIAVIVAVSLTRSGSGKSAQIIPSTPTGDVTVQPPPARVPNTTGIKGVLAWDTKGYPAPGKADAGTIGHDHVPGPVTYAVLPPVGGPHNGTWMNAGVYTKPIPSERAVHTLEHGAIWITYNPNLPANQVAALTAFVTKQSMVDESAGQSNRYLDLSPWATDALPAPIVLSAWGYQLRVQSPSDPRMQQFVNVLRHNAKYSPEFGSAVDGIPIETGGRPATDGSLLPNPSGSAE